MSYQSPGSALRTHHPALQGVVPATVIDKGSPVPLHHQLELFLRGLLEHGVLQPHELLPTEQELQEYFQLSRTPIRQALNKLAAEGLVDRRRSQGTIVLPRPFEENLRSLTTFTEEVQGKGQTPGSELLDFIRRQADAEELQMLALAAGAQVFVVRRLRFINEEPVGILTSHIPVEVAPLLRATDFADSGPQQSIYFILEQIHSLRPVRATESFRAVTLDVDDARLLQVPPHTAVLLRTRLTFDAGGRAILYDQGLYRSVYRLEWDGRQISAMDTAVAASL